MDVRLLFLLLFFSVLKKFCSSLLMCPRVCDVSKCAHSVSVGCEHGYVLDRCDCCKTCVREVGEECGGKFDGFGVCKNGLECQPRLNDGGHECKTPPGKRYSIFDTRYLEMICGQICGEFSRSRIYGGRGNTSPCL